MRPRKRITTNATISKKTSAPFSDALEVVDGDGPREDEHGFDVEDEEQQGEHVVTDVALVPAAADRPRYRIRTACSSGGWVGGGATSRAVKTAAPTRTTPGKEEYGDCGVVGEVFIAHVSTPLGVLPWPRSGPLRPGKSIRLGQRSKSCGGTGVATGPSARVSRAPRTSTTVFPCSRSLSPTMWVVHSRIWSQNSNIASPDPRPGGVSTVHLRRKSRMHRPTSSSCSTAWEHFSSTIRLPHR